MGRATCALCQHRECDAEIIVEVDIDADNEIFYAAAGRPDRCQIFVVFMHARLPGVAEANVGIVAA